MKLFLLFSALAAGTVSAHWNDDGPTLPERDDPCTTPPKNAVTEWYYNDLEHGPNDGCIEDPRSKKYWIMLASYRQGGGHEDVHWKYKTTGDVEASCLSDYTIYMGDGTTKLKDVEGEWTDYDSKGKDWCATNVYRSGGEEDYQWAYCDCE